VEPVLTVDDADDEDVANVEVDEDADDVDDDVVLSVVELNNWSIVNQVNS